MLIFAHSIFHEEIRIICIPGRFTISLLRYISFLPLVTIVRLPKIIGMLEVSVAAQKLVKFKLLKEV
ncbi:MAG: hypothetical protein C5B59_08325 [Bacteroidetes bacterium]|nr:MAG: hypothetical protein C5B59_08325 [Bacteroidota bacterium]